MKDTPNCSDEKVKEKVLKELQDKLKPKLIMNYSKANFELSTITSSIAPSTSDEPNNYPYTDSEYKKAHSYTQRVLNELKLDNIITTNLSDSKKRCNCESHIEVNYLGKLNIKYSAQSTDAGKPYVKIDLIEYE